MIESIEIKPFYNLLEHVLSVPELYSIESVKSLGQFINGFRVATAAYKIEDSDLKNFELFTKFVKQRYDIVGGYDWVRIINFYSSSSANSLKVFEKLLVEFKLSN
ncbi:MAG: hypothetical protein GQ574_25800 [Crocinitomix sp.]|nr:hypothetical protein [Crocinitomix sp.]